MQVDNSKYTPFPNCREFFKIVQFQIMLDSCGAERNTIFSLNCFKIANNEFNDVTFWNIEFII